MAESPRYKEHYPRSHPLRTTAFLVMQMLFIPVLVGMILGLNALLAWLELELPPLVHTVVFFLAFAGLYVGSGYLVAAWVERKLKRDESE